MTTPLRNDGLEAYMVRRTAFWLWVFTWASWVDEHAPEKLFPQMRYEDEAPEMPGYGLVQGGLLVGRYMGVNCGDHYHIVSLLSLFASSTDMPWDQFVESEKLLDEVAYSLAAMALGHGVGWFDDHPSFDLKVPSVDLDVCDFFAGAAEWEVSEFALREEKTYAE
jgi:hypothetical protein